MAHHELKSYAFVCEDCGYGQRGDRDGDLEAGRQWDGKTVVQAPAGERPTCPNCPSGR